MMLDLFEVRSEPAVTARTFTTFGSNFNAITAMASGTCDFNSMANCLVSPAFIAPVSPIIICAVRERGVTTKDVSIGFGTPVVTGCDALAIPLLTAATSAVAELLSSDLGAGTNEGNSSTGALAVDVSFATVALVAAGAVGVVVAAVVVAVVVVAGVVVAGVELFAATGLAFAGATCFATAFCFASFAAANWSSLSASRNNASSEPVVGDCNVPLCLISRSRGIIAGARRTRGVTAITISMRRLSFVGAVNNRPSTGIKPKIAIPCRPFAWTSVATLASIIVRLFCTRAVPVMVRSVNVGVRVLAPSTSFDSIDIFTCTSWFGKTCGVNFNVKPVGS